MTHMHIDAQIIHDIKKKSSSFRRSLVCMIISLSDFKLASVYYVRKLMIIHVALYYTINILTTYLHMLELAADESCVEFCSLSLKHNL